MSGLFSMHGWGYILSHYWLIALIVMVLVYIFVSAFSSNKAIAIVVSIISCIIVLVVPSLLDYRCDDCGSKIYANADYCETCGKPLKDITLDGKIKCNKCGERSSYDAKFCSKCGESLSSNNIADDKVEDNKDES